MTIPELRRKIGQEMGLGSFLFPFDGSPSAYRDLAPADQITLTNRMNAYVRAHPDEFTPIVQGLAQKPDIEQPTEYGLGAMASDFVGEMANQAEAINPLSEQNRGKTALMLFAVVAIAAGAYFFARGNAAGPLKLPKLPKIAK